jgi:hypothetical protein
MTEGSRQAQRKKLQYGNITFTGKSGEKYRFDAWSLETRFKPLAAVYFVTKRAFDNRTYHHRASHDSIYIGQTANLADPFATQSQFDCFRKHGANCICIYLLQDEEQRIAVEKDLMALHSTHCDQQQRIARLFDTAA